MMKRRVSFFCVALLLLGGLPVWAEVECYPDVDNRRFAFLQEETSPVTHYEQATNMLRRGQRYEEAARKLRLAIEKEPSNYRYHLALGCAYVGRVASLVQAMNKIPANARNQAKYTKWRKEWENERQNSVGATSGLAAPALPPTLVTADDNLPFQMTEEEAATRVNGLVKQAFHAYDTAKTASATPAERAETEWFRSSIIVVLRRVLTTSSPLQTKIWRDIAPKLTFKATTESMERCVTYDPQNPTY
jgi:hypothetical protein